MADIMNDVFQMRAQGLSDNMVGAELSKRYPPEQVQMALSQGNSYGQQDSYGQAGSYNQDGSYGGDNGMMEMPSPDMMPPPGMRMPPPMPDQQQSSMAVDGNIYERIEEITESMIDEKWDELIAEVKKIVEWKEKVEEKQARLLNDVQKLKDDFKVLHQGVLGKLEDYDTRMRDVGTELKAVGKVFKDVIPEFVENVKVLKGITEKQKK